MEKFDGKNRIVEKWTHGLDSRTGLNNFAGNDFKAIIQTSSRRHYYCTMYCSFVDHESYGWNIHVY